MKDLSDLVATSNGNIRWQKVQSCMKHFFVSLVYLNSLILSHNYIDEQATSTHMPRSTYLFFKPFFTIYTLHHIYFYHVYTPLRIPSTLCTSFHIREVVAEIRETSAKQGNRFSGASVRIQLSSRGEDSRVGERKPVAKRKKSVYVENRLTGIYIQAI